MILHAVKAFAKQHQTMSQKSFESFKDELETFIQENEIENIYQDNFDDTATDLVIETLEELISYYEDIQDDYADEEDDDDSEYREYQLKEAKEHLLTFEKLLDDIKTNPSEFWQPAWNFLYSL